MSTPWDFFIAYWLLLFAGVVGAAFLTIVLTAAISEIRAKWNRRRYQAASKT